MPERTDHVQPDEYPRRATGPSTDGCAVLNAAADRLSAVRPDGVMREPIRLALALRYATQAHGFRSQRADEVEREVLRLMPIIAPSSTTTRGEYALILRRAAGGAA
ncbi:hypothetical protein [Streptomyces violascens]|uniref:Uncharacterized protein n=1 Tax=Streptomyces violascens TaxID=67381 RepID=A0ABQ3QX91_9ACTN|nr:hypothetical protein [Streptomyces violascens]GGU13111.1 hypothetical protein GCM10010289_38440 [Streptomyces violascens]GHI41894.1 hypothetical protein Sviol_63020 [Streptomyces violascens]